MTGIVTDRGPAIVHRGVTVPLPATRTPLGAAVATLGAAVATLVAAIDAGELLPCIHCGAYAGCDCLDWLEWMLMADYPPLDEMTDEDLPY